MIHPDVAGYKMFDFKSAQRLVDVGYRHTVAQLEAGNGSRTWLNPGLDRPVGRCANPRAPAVANVIRVGRWV